MTSRLIYLHPGLAIALGVGLSGCIGPGERHGSTLNGRPAMPTVALPRPSSISSVSDDEVIGTAVRAADRGEISGVVRALRSVGDPSRRAGLAKAMMRQIPTADPKFTARLALALATEFQQMAVIETAGRKLVEHDAEFALRWAAKLPPGASSRLMWRAIIDELVLSDPRAAVDQIAALPAGTVRDEMLVLAAGAWARVNTDAAISWLSELPDEEIKPRLISSVGFEVAQTLPERAITVAEMLPEGRDRWLLFSAIAQTWVAVDSKSAFAWAGKLPAGEPRDAALAGIDTGSGVPASRRIARAPGVRGGGSRTRGGTAVATVGPESNSADFAAWVATQRTGMSREEAILEYVRQRGASEPAAIGPLIASLPSGYTRDEATRIYVEGLMIGSPREAAQWVNALPRSERSDELVEKTARRYLQTNPEAAVQWLEHSMLPPDRKEQLLREAGR